MQKIILIKKEVILMKLIPRFNLFEDEFTDSFGTKNPLSTSHQLMKTDIRLKDGNYTLNMELPGYKKEDIKLELKDGTLRIEASRTSSNETKDENGKFIHQERYFGTCSRKFYVGESIKQEDIKARFENGELTVEFPAETEDKSKQKHFIPID